MVNYATHYNTWHIVNTGAPSIYIYTMTTNPYSLPSGVDICSIQRDQVCVSHTDLVHAVPDASSQNAVQVWLAGLGGKRHDHVFALGHLKVRDDTEPGLLDGTRV